MWRSQTSESGPRKVAKDASAEQRTSLQWGIPASTKNPSAILRTSSVDTLLFCRGSSIHVFGGQRHVPPGVHNMDHGGKNTSTRNVQGKPRKSGQTAYEPQRERKRAADG